MFSNNDILYTIFAFTVFIISASLLSGYLGSVGLRSTTKIQEGFDASEANIDRLNEKVSTDATDIKDQLNVEKYKDDYKRLISLSKDYLEGLQLAVLLNLKSIDPNKDDDKQLIEKCEKTSQSLTTLHNAVKSINEINLNNI